MDSIGVEGTRQTGFDFALLAVVEHGPGQFHRRRRVSDVVGDDLASVDVLVERARRAEDNVASRLNGVARGGEIRC